MLRRGGVPGGTEGSMNAECGHTTMSAAVDKYQGLYFYIELHQSRCPQA